MSGDDVTRFTAVMLLPSRRCCPPPSCASAAKGCTMRLLSQSSNAPTRLRCSWTREGRLGFIVVVGFDSFSEVCGDVSRHAAGSGVGGSTKSHIFAVARAFHYTYCLIKARRRLRQMSYRYREFRDVRPNHALQRARWERRGRNPCIPCAGSLSSGVRRQDRT